jgi:thymidylate synthase ThyX
MQRDLTEIRELAEQMRREKKTGPTVKPAAVLKPASVK